MAEYHGICRNITEYAGISRIDITKFVDDSSIFEVVLQNTRSKLDQTLSKTSEWVDRNYMELNGKKQRN
jgi:hypothetical protein